MINLIILNRFSFSTFQDGDFMSLISILVFWTFQDGDFTSSFMIWKEIKLYVKCVSSRVISRQKLKNMEFCERIYGHLFGIVVSMFDCHSRGPGFDSRLNPRNVSWSIGSGTGSTQPREDNWVATWMRSSKIRLRKLKLRLRDKSFANHKAPVLPSGSNCFSRSWLFGAVAPRI